MKRWWFNTRATQLIIELYPDWMSRISYIQISGLGDFAQGRISETVIRSFRKCGISLSLDGSENDVMPDEAIQEENVEFHLESEDEARNWQKTPRTMESMKQ